MTVASMGNARAWRRVTIQMPGLGKACATAGTQLANKKGKAKPRPMQANTDKACQAGMVIATPKDAPINGAVQGEATATASTPDTNASTRGWRDCNAARLAGSTLPMLKTSHKFKAIRVKSAARAATTAGVCN